MSGFFDDSTITFGCPECDHGIAQTIGRLKNEEEITCPGSGVTIQPDVTDFAPEIEKAEAAIERLLESFDNLGR